MADVPPGLEFGSAHEDAPELVQLLTPEGERLDDPRFSPLVEHLTAQDLCGFYRDMVLVRRIDAEATALQRQGELGLWPSLLGQEAAQIGSARATRAQDYVFPTYREHGVAWVRGVDPLAVLALFRGVTHGGWDPTVPHVQNYSIVIGAHTLHAVGYAMGLQRDGVVGTGDPGRDAAAVAYFGDGATAQGDVNEAFVFGAVQRAPVVFFCQNNQWAISEPTERQSTIPLYQRARGFGFPGVRVDGNDVLAVHAVTAAALDRARAGEGPTLVEAFTYRMGAHTTSDDPTRYRDAAEVEAWALKDPITRLRTHLARSALVPPDFFDAVRAEGEEIAARLRTACVRMPDPAPTEMFEHAYAEHHPLVAAERQWFETYQASFLQPERVE